MIILRYLTREVLVTTLAVTSVLLVIIMSGRFVKYLAEAAAGKMDASVLFSVMFYRMPGFLELILPLGFFVALLLAYGRMYTDHEMTVLFSCGVSRKKLIAWTYLPATLVALIIAALSLWISPLSLQKAEEILAQQETRNEFDSLQAAKFQALGSGKTVTYTEGIVKDSNNDKETLQSFFLAKVGVSAQDALTTVRAVTAERIENEQYTEPYLLLNDGVRYEGRPGNADYRVTEFELFAQHIEPPAEIAVTRNKVNRLPTSELLGSSQADYQAAFQWRVSAPLLVLIVTLLGVLFSHTNPRRGRYAMLFPAILLYLIYLVMLNAARGAVEESRLSAAVGLWGVHALFLMLGLVFLSNPKMWRNIWLSISPFKILGKSQVSKTHPTTEGR